MPNSHGFPQRAIADDSLSTTLTRELLARYLAGDLDAERKLFERYRETLVARARASRLMRGIEREVQPDDVAQEVMWRVLSSGVLRGFEDRGRGSLEAALTTILERTMVDMRRRLRARKRGGDRIKTSLDDAQADERRMLDAQASSETTPTNRARTNELFDICRRVLDERERAAWELVELRGFDSERAAGQLDTSASAVRGLLLRARAKLVRALGDERGAGDSRS